MSLTNGKQLLNELKTPCEDEDVLDAWVQKFCGLKVPRTNVCAGHCAPFEYLKRAYFEPAGDLVVWAPCGGGKTRLGAAATMLDLLHKPGISVRILGGSFEQSLKMWEHLVPNFEEVSEGLVRAVKGRRVELMNGSVGAVIAQSQRAVRGLRVQKMRCDEVEMFEPEVWDAAQLVTKSKDDEKGGEVKGIVEAISTLHNPWGLMHRVVEKAEKKGTLILKWCLMEVLEKCPPERECGSCKLWDECRGRAKDQCDGFFKIEDALTIKRRVSKETWECEVLCLRPSLEGAVFPSFDRAVHVKEETPAGEMSLAVDFGFKNPFVCLWMVTDALGMTHVVDEYVQAGRTVEEKMAHVEARQWGKVRVVACDPAGAGVNEQTAESNIALLRRRGYRVRHRASRIPGGIDLIRTELRRASGEVRLFINPCCERLIKAMQGYHYSPGGSELPVKDGENDHLVDALRYHFVNRVTEKVHGERRY